MRDRNTLLAQTESWQQTQADPTLAASAIANGYQGFPGFDWQIEIAQQRTQALAPIRHMATIFIGILVVTVLLASLIVLPVATSITRPLARLTRFANNFMRTSSSSLPPAGGPAEVEMMANAFGKMITDLERSKEELMRAAKLAVAGEMAAAMSHEVRTPLGILRSSAQVLLREPELSEEAREVCGFIISETERLNRLVSTLIDSARPRKPELLATDLTALVQQSVAMLKMQAEKKHIELTYTADGAAFALAADAYAIDIDAGGQGWLRVLAPGAAGRARVTYQAGLAADWAGVPAPLAQGVVLLAAHLFSGAAGEPPAAVTALWRPWRRLRLAGERAA